MTFNEAKKMGYRVAFMKRELGYVSRKVNIGDQVVQEAGGYRKGMLYVKAPAFDSTRYSWRVYIEKED